MTITTSFGLPTLLPLSVSHPFVVRLNLHLDELLFDLYDLRGDTVQCFSNYMNGLGRYVIRQSYYPRGTDAQKPIWRTLLPKT